MSTPSVHFSMRVPKRLAAELSRFASRTGASVSSAATELLKEGLRMAEVPGIDFRWTPTGRRAHVIGTGLTVWELHAIFRDHGASRARVLKNYPHLTAAQLDAALRYAAEYGDEKPEQPRPARARVVRV